MKKGSETNPEKPAFFLWLLFQDACMQRVLITATSGDDDMSSYFSSQHFTPLAKNFRMTSRRPGMAIASSLLIGCLSGCNWITQASDDTFKVDKFAVYRTDSEITSSSNSGEDLKKQPDTISITQIDSYQKPASVSSRNELLNFLVARSNEKCESHKAKIVGYNSIINFGASGATTLLAGAGAIVAGPVGARVLSAGAAATSATQSHFNENFYQNLIGPAINREIDAKRNAVLEEIKTKRNKTIEEYSKDDVVNDVLAYHDECSFYRGLQYLTQEKEKRTDPVIAINTNIDAIKASITYYEEKIASYKTAGDAKAADQMRKTLLELHDNLAVQEKVKQVVRAGTSAPPQSRGSEADATSGSASGTTNTGTSPGGTAASGSTGTGGTGTPPAR